MSGETEKAVSGWTVDTLHQHIQVQLESMWRQLDERAAKGDKAVDAALAAADKLIQAALIAAEKAVDKANDASERRFESVNEFRAQLTDQAATFVRRDEVDVRLTTLGERHNETNTRITKIEEKAIGHSEQRTEGRDAGKYVATVIGAVLGLIGIVSFLLSLKK